MKQNGAMALHATPVIVAQKYYYNKMELMKIVSILLRRHSFFSVITSRIVEGQNTLHLILEPLALQLQPDSLMDKPSGC